MLFLYIFWPILMFAFTLYHYDFSRLLSTIHVLLFKRSSDLLWIQWINVYLSMPILISDSQARLVQLTQNAIFPWLNVMTMGLSVMSSPVDLKLELHSPLTNSSGSSPRETRGARAEMFKSWARLCCEHKRNTEHLTHIINIHNCLSLSCLPYNLQSIHSSGVECYTNLCTSSAHFQIK